MPDPLEDIVQDRTRGASELAADAIAVLERAVAARTDAPREAMLEAALPMLQAHPAMAALINLVNDAVAGLERDGGRVFERLRKQRQERIDRTVAMGLQQLEEARRVATYSRSGTVLATLRQWSARRRDGEVLVSEARPALEGLTVARELASAGTRVTVTYDAALPTLVHQVDAVMIGADALTGHGIVNKAGTGALLRAARGAGVPTIVAAATDKLLSSLVPASAVLQPRAPMEPPGEGIGVDAPTFESFSYALPRIWVSDQGAAKPADAADLARQLDLHPALLERLQKVGLARRRGRRDGAD